MHGFITLCYTIWKNNFLFTPYYVIAKCKKQLKHITYCTAHARYFLSSKSSLNILQSNSNPIQSTHWKKVGLCGRQMGHMSSTKYTMAYIGWNIQHSIALLNCDTFMQSQECPHTHLLNSVSVPMHDWEFSQHSNLIPR